MSSNLIGAVLRMSASMAIILGLIYATLYMLRLNLRLREGRDSKRRIMHLSEMVSLGANRSLHLVRIGGRSLVIGSTPSSINLITELDEENLGGGEGASAGAEEQKPLVGEDRFLPKEEGLLTTMEVNSQRWDMYSPKLMGLLKREGERLHRWGARISEWQRGWGACISEGWRRGLIRFHDIIRKWGACISKGWNRWRSHISGWWHRQVIHLPKWSELSEGIKALAGRMPGGRVRGEGNISSGMPGSGTADRGNMESGMPRSEPAGRADIVSGRSGFERRMEGRIERLQRIGEGWRSPSSSKKSGNRKRFQSILEEKSIKLEMNEGKSKELEVNEDEGRIER